MAVKYHPDKNQGNKDSESRFKEVSEAYEVLGDPERHHKYDTFGHAGLGGEGPGGFDFRGSGAGDIFGDIFEDFFGGNQGRRGTRAERGADLQYNLEISLEEAAYGKEARVRIPKWENCPGCKGTGAKSPAGIRTCPTCSGSGSIRFQQGFFSINRTCSHCQGEGRVISDPCKKCKGAKRIHRDKTLTVKIPPGVESGNRLRLTGEGEPGGHGGPPGDLYVFLTVKPHPVFSRKGHELLCEATLTFGQASLGSKIEVPTLKGPAHLKIPAGTQNGRTFRIKGFGMTHLGGRSIGDLLVRIRVKIPTKLSRRQRELLEEFSTLEGHSVESEESIFAKVKNIFD